MFLANTGTINILVKLQKTYVGDVVHVRNITRERSHGFMSHTGKSDSPFSRIQADFIEMPACNGVKYVLVLVCLFWRCVQAYPTRRSDSMTEAKLLLRELVLRFGLPVSIETDRGTHFKN